MLPDAPAAISTPSPLLSVIESPPTELPLLRRTLLTEYPTVTFSMRAHE
jgi:hypothetical protein